MNDGSDQIRQLRRWLLLMFLLAVILAMLWRQVPTPASACEEKAATDCPDNPVAREDSFPPHPYRLAPHTCATGPTNVLATASTRTPHASTFRPPPSQG